MSSYGIWLSAAGMKVSDHRQTLAANNMANANTTGFKRDMAVVMQRPVESRESASNAPFAHKVLSAMGGGLDVRQSQHDFSQGSLDITGRSLDVAISDDGFFAVSDGTRTRYTRDGQFNLNDQGELVLDSGHGRWRVLDEGQSTIQLDPSGGEINISPTGDLLQGQEVVARLGVFAAEAPQSLRKAGENLWDAGQQEMRPIQAKLVPGAREESNVDIMTGLVGMVEASRAYQLNATMIQLQDQATGQAISTLGRLP